MSLPLLPTGLAAKMRPEARTTGSYGPKDRRQRHALPTQVLRPPGYALILLSRTQVSHATATSCGYC